MKLFRIIKHILIVLAGVVIIVGVPLLCTGYIGSLISGSTDAVAGASVVLDEPSGEFIILLNKDFHPDESTVNDWVRFFSKDFGEDELLIIFDDISCSVPAADTAGAEMADSLRSQLPENQMKVVKEDITLIASQADAGLFDVILMSKEYADSCHLETAIKENVQVIEVMGEAGEEE